MIIGIGVDLIEIKRVSEAIKKDAFVKRCYTDREISMIGKNACKAADNFAVKEAVAKMLGTGFTGISLKDIEVLRDSRGKPYVIITGRAADMAKEQGITAVHVSITNTSEYANAFVVGEGKQRA